MGLPGAYSRFWKDLGKQGDRCNFGCNIGELGGILGVIFVNLVGYVSGPLKWVQYW